MGQGGMALRPNLVPSKFQEKLYGASRMPENPFSGRGGAYRAHPDPLAGGEGADKEPYLRSRLSGPRASANWASPLTRNRRLGLSQHDGLGQPLP